MKNGTRDPRMPRPAFALAAALVASLACAHQAPPSAPTLADVRAAKTRGEMLRTTTLDPLRCTWSRPGHELCVWRLGNRNSVWYALAGSIATRYRVNLICEFPTDGSPSERECAILAAASPPTVGSAARRFRVTAAEAQRQLDEANTVWQLSELVGDAPQRCSAVDAKTQFCVWQANNQTQGFAVLVNLLEQRARVQISCSFPADGSARPAGSCRAEPS